MDALRLLRACEEWLCGNGLSEMEIAPEVNNDREVLS